MAKILTFQSRSSSNSGQDFLTDEANTLSFDLSDEGDVSLGDLSHANFSGLFPDPKKDWSNQELADLFRVRHLLSVANVPVTTDRGVSDEGDPWFVFCRANGEVFIHLCRIDGQYVLDSPTVMRPLRGADFGALISDFTQNAVPAADDGGGAPGRVIRLERGSNVRLHPSAMLAALIWSLFLALEDLVLLAPEGALADDDGDLLDFEGVFGVGASAEFDVDTLIVQTPTETAGEGLDAAEVRGTVDVPDAGVQMRDAALQQGLTLNANAFTMGLSTIAIAMGFMSETVLLDNQRKVMETLASLGLWDAATDTGAEQDLDDVAGNSESSALLAMLGDFLGLESSLHEDAPEIAEQRADRLGDDPVGAALLADVQDQQPGAPAAGKLAPGAFEKAATGNDGASEGAARDASGAVPPAVVSAGGDTVSGDTGGDAAPVTLLEVVQNWQPQMEVMQLGQTMILTSFDLTDGTASILASLIDTPEERKPQHIYEVDLTAQRLVHFLEAKEGEIGFIEFKDEIIMVDRTAVTGGDTDFIQWEAADGRTISFIGLAADLQAFDMIA